jgi:DNA polymerase-3 subunit epsilon
VLLTNFIVDKALDGAHSAEVDAQATWEILLAQVERYPNIGTTVESIVKIYRRR